MIAIPRLSAPAPPTAEEAAAAASAARTASARLPTDAATGLVSTPWYGKEWSSNKLGIKPKHATPSLEELRARFPGLDDASLAEVDRDADGQTTARTLDLAAAATATTEDGETAMEDADESAAAAAVAASSTPKKPLTSLSRRGSIAPASSKSRAASRAASRAPSAPGSPSLGATPTKSSGSGGNMDDLSLGGGSGGVMTPSRVPVGGATWKVVSAGQSPSHALATSGAVKSKTLRKSWADKQKKRESFLADREAQRRLSEAESEQRKELARKAKQKADMKLANEKKNQIVQVITDTRKIKNMSKKQLRGIQKMDTGAFKSNSVTTGGLSRGIVPKGE